jgi:hypothetical protein
MNYKADDAAHFNGTVRVNMLAHIPVHLIQYLPTFATQWFGQHGDAIQRSGSRYYNTFYSYCSGRAIDVRLLAFLDSMEYLIRAQPIA